MPADLVGEAGEGALHDPVEGLLAYSHALSLLFSFFHPAGPGPKAYLYCILISLEEKVTRRLGAFAGGWT